MKLSRVVVVAVSFAAVWGAGPLAAAGAAATGVVGPARAAPAAGSWAKAIAIPGLAALKRGGTAVVLSVSCGSAGSCAAGGWYAARHRRRQGFVAVERNGRWDPAIEVPGLAALNTGGDGGVLSVSCGSAGSCAAGGWYTARHRRQRGFVAVERNGRWDPAIEVPGLTALDKGGGDAEVSSVSCGSAGSCAAGGFYRDRHGHPHGLVAVERNGRWGRAIEVPGLAALDKGGSGAVVVSVSCGSAGSCAAGGFYRDRQANAQGFVAVERNGRWGRAIEVPGLAALKKGGIAQVVSVSCGSAGSCAAGGFNGDGHGHRLGFVAVERNGRWGRAIEVPGLATLNTGRHSRVISVSCGSAGSCAAVGDYADSDGVAQGFVADEDDGRWVPAIAVPGLAALNTGGFVQVLSVSCGSAGNCVVGGDYTRRDLSLQGFVADERNGHWGDAIDVPGLMTLNKGGGAFVGSVSCGSAGNCAAGGEYNDRHHKGQGFVAVERSGR